jgi:hypothetical protein
MTRPKVIVITLLAVLVALGSASLFAQNGSSATTATLKLTPTVGCPGTPILVDIVYPGDANVAPGGVTDNSGMKLTSYPDGLIYNFNKESFTVADSVCAGDYVVTAELAVTGGVGTPATTESVSTHFTVGGNGCPNLPVCRPVGGVVMPTNTLAITAPYLALAGLIVAVSAVVLVKRKRD